MPEATAAAETAATATATKTEGAAAPKGGADAGSAGASPGPNGSGDKSGTKPGEQQATAEGEGAGKEGEAGGEKPKPDKAWEAQLRWRRQEQKKLDEQRAEIAKLTSDAQAKIKDAESLTNELKPLAEALKAKDWRKVLQLSEVSLQSIVDGIADEGKEPTGEEIAKKATEAAEAKAREIIENDRKAREDADKKAREDAEARAQKESDARFNGAVAKRHDAVSALLKGEAAAEKFEDAIQVHELFASIEGGNEETEHTIRYGKTKDGTPLVATVKGGTYLTREAIRLTLKIHHETGDAISPEKALELVQKQISPALLKLAERRSGTASTKSKSEPEKKTKPGGAAQPTITNRNTTGPVVDPEERDDGNSAVTMDAVTRAAMKALPHLRAELR